MRTLNPREKQTVRLGAIAIVVYLLLFGGVQLWKACERQRLAYQKLGQEAQGLKEVIQLYEDRAAAARKLMEEFKLDPARLARTTVVAEASAAIQKAAATGGIQVGPVRESPARSASKELATVQIEGIGPVPAVTALLHRLQSVGFPLVIETMQLTPETAKPGQVKLSLTIVILDFEQWKREEPTHA